LEGREKKIENEQEDELNIQIDPFGSCVDLKNKLM